MVPSAVRVASTCNSSPIYPILEFASPNSTPSIVGAEVSGLVFSSLEQENKRTEENIANEIFFNTLVIFFIFSKISVQQYFLKIIIQSQIYIPTQVMGVIAKAVGVFLIELIQQIFSRDPDSEALVLPYVYSTPYGCFK